MKFNFDASQLIAGLAALKENIELGAAHGADDIAPLITDALKDSKAHGDVTGATRASYVAYRVGLGKNGQEALDSLDAVGALNPGHSAHDTVTINGLIGIILMSGTDYQYKLETERAGEKAVLTPTFQAYYLAITEAIANGIRDNL